MVGHLQVGPLEGLALLAGISRIPVEGEISAFCFPDGSASSTLLLSLGVLVVLLFLSLLSTSKP